MSDTATDGQMDAEDNDVFLFDLSAPTLVRHL